MLTRVCLTAALAGAVAVAGAVPAWAGDGWGSVDCDQVPSPTCDLGAGTEKDQNDKQRREQRRDHDRDRNDRKSPDPPHESQPDDRVVGGARRLANCEYVRSDYVPPESISTTMHAAAPTGRPARVDSAAFVSAAAPQAQPTPRPNQAGAWYVYRCSGQGFRDALYRPPIWIPDQPTPQDTVARVSPADLARQAYRQLWLGSPRIGVNPAGDQLVHLPTWLWLEPGSWGEVSATASVPGVSVTAVARPTKVSWSMGDGGSVTCEGPGTRFTTEADPASSSPDCGYTYRVPSVGQPGEVFTVTATVHWTVTWSGAGESGAFPDMTTDAVAWLRVAEAQALNTR